MNEKVLPGQGLGFSDVLLVPNRSDVRSRFGDQIDLSTAIAHGVPQIHLPIISANMDTVTEAEMAITMALHGSIGVIHRFMTVKDQAQEVARVKGYMRTIEDDPPFLPETATIADAQQLLEKRPRGYVIVHHGPLFSGSFSGIATKRDFLVKPSDAPLSLIMTPREQMVTVQKGTTLEEAVGIMTSHRIEKVPVVDGDGKLVGVYTLKDNELFQRFPHASLDREGRLMVGAAIGVQQNDRERAHALENAHSDLLVLDIAHGELDYTGEMLNVLKNKEDIRTPISAGNVATRQGAIYVRDSGADGIKVGVGPGYVCDTRNVAGAGVPQITAILEVANALANDSQPLPIIADGGVREPGDVSKAIGAGADAVMIGSLFAGTEQSPGEPVIMDGTLQKMVRGMASAPALEARKKIGNTSTDERQYAPEGSTKFIPYKGKVEKILFELAGGLRSGMSYVGTHTIPEMKEKARFYRVSPGVPEQRRPLQ